MKNHKNHLAAGGEPPTVIRLMHTSLLSTTTRLDIFQVQNFIMWLKPCLSIIVLAQLKTLPPPNRKSWLHFCSYVHVVLQIYKKLFMIFFLHILIYLSLSHFY